MTDFDAAGPAAWPASLQPRTAELREHAQLQSGVLTRSQLAAAGVTDKVIISRLGRGRWQRLHRGVYATFSGVPSRDCLLWAAVLRAGPGAVLSHQTAAELWGLGGEASAAIHLTVPSGSPAPRLPGVVWHYSLRIDQARHPVLAPPRTRVEETVLDLAVAAGTAEDAMAWVFRACGSRQTTAGRLLAAMGTRPRMRWRAALRRALDPENAGVHSILEYRYVRGVERPHGLPAGARQRLVARDGRRQYSDVEYDGYDTIVELDGRAAYPEISRLLDARRDNANAADGRVTLRYGWAEVSERRCEVAAQVASALRLRGWTGSLRRCGATCRLSPAANSR